MDPMWDFMQYVYTADWLLLSLMDGAFCLSGIALSLGRLSPQEYSNKPWVTNNKYVHACYSAIDYQQCGCCAYLGTIGDPCCLSGPGVYAGVRFLVALPKSNQCRPNTDLSWIVMKQNNQPCSFLCLICVQAWSWHLFCSWERGEDIFRQADDCAGTPTFHVVAATLPPRLCREGAIDCIICHQRVHHSLNKLNERSMAKYTTHQSCVKIAKNSPKSSTLCKTISPPNPSFSKSYKVHIASFVISLVYNHIPDNGLANSDHRLLNTFWDL